MTGLWKYLVVKWRRLFAITPEENYPAMTISLLGKTSYVRMKGLRLNNNNAI